MPEYIYDIKALDLSKRYSYADYLLWRFKERVELFKGKVFEMSPEPSTSHQRTSMKIYDLLKAFYQNHDCELFVAPFDVELFSKNDTKSSVVQSDLCVICDPNKIDERGCHGAPDLVVEILSKGNSRKEIQHKYDLYEEASGREYWIVDYMRRTVLIQVLNKKGVFQSQRLLAEGDRVTSFIFPEFSCPVEDIFKGVTDSLNELGTEYAISHSTNRL